MTTTNAPDVLPVLSAGKHRNPHKGACFMEFASYLAGERWSDQPECTHELLAGLARLVNDNVSDATRTRLVELIPRVVGLNSPDPLIYPVLSIRAASAAIGIAPRAHQRALAVGILAAERFLIENCGEVPAPVQEMIDDAFDSAPEAVEWARGFRRGVKTSGRMFTRRAAPRVVLNAVDGVVRSTHAEPDRLLREMLEAAIEDCEQLCGTRPDDPAQDTISVGTSRQEAPAPTS